jgi:hypothetical protein
VTLPATERSAGSFRPGEVDGLGVVLGEIRMRFDELFHQWIRILFSECWRDKIVAAGSANRSDRGAISDYLKLHLVLVGHGFANLVVGEFDIRGCLLDVTCCLRSRLKPNRRNRRLRLPDP